MTETKKEALMKNLHNLIEILSLVRTEADKAAVLTALYNVEKEIDSLS